MTAILRTIAVALAVVMTALGAYAQNETKIEKKKVRGAYGEWSMSPDMTGDEIMERARHEAKEDALRKAGVGENVWSIFGMLTSSTSSTFMEAYSEMTVMSIEGKVKVIDTDCEWILRDGNPIYTVMMDAEIIVDNTEEDRTFAMKSYGIKDTYLNGEKCHCTFTIDGSDAYLKVFFFNEEMAGLIYPTNPEDKMRLYECGQSYRFPAKGALQMGKNGSGAENIVLLFVATKKNYPYLGEDDATSILQWVYSIPADERALEMKQCVIL